MGIGIGTGTGVGIGIWFVIDIVSWRLQEGSGIARGSSKGRGSYPGASRRLQEVLRHAGHGKQMCFILTMLSATYVDKIIRVYQLSSMNYDLA